MVGGHVTVAGTDDAACVSAEQIIGECETLVTLLHSDGILGLPDDVTRGGRTFIVVVQQEVDADSENR